MLLLLFVLVFLKNFVSIKEISCLLSTEVSLVGQFRAFFKQVFEKEVYQKGCIHCSSYLSPFAMLWFTL